MHCSRKFYKNFKITKKKHLSLDSSKLSSTAFYILDAIFCRFYAQLETICKQSRFTRIGNWMTALKRRVGLQWFEMLAGLLSTEHSCKVRLRTNELRMSCFAIFIMFYRLFTCLNNDNTASAFTDTDTRLIGQRYDADMQCQVYVGSSQSKRSTGQPFPIAVSSTFIDFTF